VNFYLKPGQYFPTNCRPRKYFHENKSEDPDIIVSNDYSHFAGLIVKFARYIRGAGRAKIALITSMGSLRVNFANSIYGSILLPLLATRSTKGIPYGLGNWRRVVKIFFELFFELFLNFFLNFF
jgi:hypothetical protein